MPPARKKNQKDAAGNRSGKRRIPQPAPASADRVQHQAGGNHRAGHQVRNPALADVSDRANARAQQ